MKPIRVGLLGFEGVTGLDLAGPMEALSSSRLLRRDARGKQQPGYELLVIGVDAKEFRSTSGLRLRPDVTLANAPALDTLIIPGGEGLREPTVNARVTRWLKQAAPGIRRVGSVCTGIYGLAPSGLLDGKRATTHWENAADIAEKFPAIRLEANTIFVFDGSVFTSAGASSSIDLSLALIEADYGAQAALAVARQLVVYLKRPGGQDQYSEPLQFQSHASGAFGDLLPWMLGNLQADLSVEALAARVHLSPRQFVRRFKAAFKESPGQFVENLRLDEARSRLDQPRATVEQVAASVGFASADSFRRAFDRRFHINPSAYRGRFVGGDAS